MFKEFEKETQNELHTYLYCPHERYLLHGPVTEQLNGNKIS